MNNVRGYLAEFLVAKVVGASGPRAEWDAFDVLMPSDAGAPERAPFTRNVKIEVKSSARLQAWDQRHPSRIAFTGLKGRTWDPRLGESPEATYNADVYVFAVHTIEEHELYRQLDVGQWDFYVLPKSKLVELDFKGLTLRTLIAHAGEAASYAQLKDRILDNAELELGVHPEAGPSPATR